MSHSRRIPTLQTIRVKLELKEMISWQGKKIPFIYVFFYKLMREHAGNNLFISYQDTIHIFKMKIYNVPRTYHLLILQDMEELGIIKKIGTGSRSINYQFTGKDLDKKLNKFNETLF